jgi:hypothetical protein
VTPVVDDEHPVALARLADGVESAVAIEPVDVDVLAGTNFRAARPQFTPPDGVARPALDDDVVRVDGSSHLVGEHDVRPVVGVVPAVGDPLGVEPARRCGLTEP